MSIFRHPDGSHHRYPYRERIEVLTRVPGRPDWWRDAKGVERYVEPAKPPQPVIDTRTGKPIPPI